MKDNFSAQATQYAQFRPTYPTEFYDFLLSEVKNTNIAWDCATGNGQVAVELARHFNQVYATDISEKQLANAAPRPNVSYSVAPAERTGFADHSFDLITVAQAIHWFSFDEFFAEVKRTLKPDGLFVAIGYGLMKISPAVDEIIDKLYGNILGGYWDSERKHIESAYATINFPFSETKSPTLEILTTWNFQQLTGYLETWSSVQHYLKANNQNPIDLIRADLIQAWGHEQYRQVHFPLIIKAGRFS